MIIKVNEKNGFYEIWNNNKIVISSSNLDGIVLSKKELNTLAERGQILIKDNKRVDSILAWCVFL